MARKNFNLSFLNFYLHIIVNYSHINMSGFSKRSFVCPTVVVSHDPKVAQQQLQELLDRKRALGAALASSEGASSISPHPKGKKIKRKHTYKAKA